MGSVWTRIRAPWPGKAVGRVHVYVSLSAPSSYRYGRILLGIVISRGDNPCYCYVLCQVEYVWQCVASVVVQPHRVLGNEESERSGSVPSCLFSGPVIWRVRILLHLLQYPHPVFVRVFVTVIARKLFVVLPQHTANVRLSIFELSLTI